MNSRLRECRPCDCDDPKNLHGMKAKKSVLSTKPNSKDTKAKLGKKPLFRPMGGGLAIPQK